MSRLAVTWPPEPETAANLTKGVGVILIISSKHLRWQLLRIPRIDAVMDLNDPNLMVEAINRALDEFHDVAYVQGKGWKQGMTPGTMQHARFALVLNDGTELPQEEIPKLTKHAYAIMVRDALAILRNLREASDPLG